MQLSRFVRFFLCIASCLSVARAFSMTVGTPSQCDDLTVSWTGGQAPFEILLTPSLETYQNITVPASAFSNGKGSYSISQLPLSMGTLFILTMSDATGFGSGGTTNQLTVGNPVANNKCSTTVSSPPYEFGLSPSQLTQCNQFTIAVDSGAVLPLTIVQLIPGGQPVVFNSVNSYTLTSVVNVNTGTNLQYFVTDSTGRQGGVSGFEQVLGSSNSSCLSANSPSSTAGISATATASPSSSSSSSPSSSSSSNVALIAGAAGGGAAFLIALTILGMCFLRKRRASRLLDVQSSSLQRTDPKYEVSHHSDVPPQFPFPYKTNPLSYHTRPIQPSLRTQSDMTNSSAGNFAVSAPRSSFHQTQHSHQSSNTDFPVYGDARSSTMSSAYNRTAAMSQPTSPNYPLPYPVGYPPPIRPGSQSPPLNASTGNFTVSDHPTLFNQRLHSRQNSNADFSVYGDTRSSAMSSVDRRMATVAETSLPLPWETDSVSYLGPPIQSGSKPSPINNASVANLVARDLPAPVEHMAVGPRPASPLPQKTDPVYLAPPVHSGSQSISTQASAGNFAVSNPPTPFNQTQNSRQSPDTNSLAVYGASGSQSMASASAQTAATATGQAAYQPPARIIVHTDADDIIPDDNGVVELPPQYSEHRGVRAL
ncbi:hypothetical protein EV702DRAFT_547216 [Suillus placidus]|uniref:Uncharacterized protein n=1 Tax=Suillus placidus TaxID=48579 RepID=A0A9P6ZQ10_9AGAM|nr:hypothetical protein EV702DRAFT_547216 [Suillus placidus]